MRPLFFSLTVLVAVSTTSCDLLKPKDAAASTYDPYGQQSNPYGQVPASNPYSQTPAANPYSQAPAPNPYGQTPAANPYGSYEPAQTSTTPAPSPYNSTPAYSGGASAGSGRSVVVKSGDTLTAIARRNSTSVAALKSTNGLTSDVIKIGQKLNLP